MKIEYSIVIFKDGKPYKDIPNIQELVIVASHGEEGSLLVEATGQFLLEAAEIVDEYIISKL